MANHIWTDVTVGGGAANMDALVELVHSTVDEAQGWQMRPYIAFEREPSTDGEDLVFQLRTDWVGAVEIVAAIAGKMPSHPVHASFSGEGDPPEGAYSFNEGASAETPDSTPVDSGSPEEEEPPVAGDSIVDEVGGFIGSLLGRDEPGGEIEAEAAPDSPTADTGATDTPPTADTPEEAAAPAGPGPIRLCAEGREITMNITTPLNLRAVRQFGDDSRFWDNNAQMIIRSEPDGWWLDPCPDASNDTLLNGTLVEESMLLSNGDQVAVGKASEGVVKLPLTVALT